MIKFHVITIFPEAFKTYFETSLLGKAQKHGLIKINLFDLRRFANDKHKTVDDKPYGGGPGMVLKVEPIFKATEFLRKKAKIQNTKTRVILFSTRGKNLDRKTARRLSKYKNLILICGRYEGVDERVARYIADEEISVGNYVLSGGELPAMLFIEAVSRYIDGVLGKRESLEELKGSYPVYSRPEKFRDWQVPEVLLSGNHKKIEDWRSKLGKKYDFDS